MDRAGEGVRHRRAEGLRRQAVAGHGCGGSRDDAALQPGTNRGKGKQAQARQALDVRAREVRSAAPARALRSELKARASQAESPWLRVTKYSEEPVGGTDLARSAACHAAQWSLARLPL